MNNKLGRRQSEMLEIIRDHIDKVGYAPTIRELGLKMNLTSTSTVANHLAALERKGYIERKSASPRAIKILPA